MLYVRVNNKMDFPTQWDRVQDMFKYLNRMMYGYQIIMERKMFATREGGEYRATLIKWATSRSENRREVLLETDNPEQMEAALVMLISEADTLAQAHKVSMVP